MLIFIYCRQSYILKIKNNYLASFIFTHFKRIPEIKSYN